MKQLLKEPHDYVESFKAACQEHGVDVSIEETIVLGDHLSEYKRRQAPPGIKITPKAFGRDRRMPITNRYSG